MNFYRRDSVIVCMHAYNSHKFRIYKKAMANVNLKVLLVHLVGYDNILVGYCESFHKRV